MTTTDGGAVSPDTAYQQSAEHNEHVKFVFNILDDIHKIQNQDPRDLLSMSIIQTIVDHHLVMRDPRVTNHGQRITHFILYLNTKVESVDWVKEDLAVSQHLSRYIHGKPIHSDSYSKVVQVLNLKQYMGETIMCTPYSFSRDLVDIYLEQIKRMTGMQQLIASEDLIMSWIKCIKRHPVKPCIEDLMITKFNEVMLTYVPDTACPFDSKKMDTDENYQKEINKFSGYRVRSIFKVFVDIIKFQSNPGKHRQYPMYTMKPIRSSNLLDSTSADSTGDTLYKKMFDIVMYKCMNMCDFTIDTWLSWYEVEVIEEDTNLQACIGHLIHELCTFIDNGVVNEPYLKEFRGILRNMAIEKLNFSDVDITDINSVIDRVQSSSKFHISAWIKKMIQNTAVYTHPRAVYTLDRYMKCIDLNCLRALIDSMMNYFKSGGLVCEDLVNAIYKGIKNLDMEDKLSILKHFMTNYSSLSFFVQDDFDKLLNFIAHNEYSHTVDKKEIMSKLIWLAMQEPKRMLHKLVAQYVTGIYGLPVKGIDSKRSCLHQVNVYMHLHMKPSDVYEIYGTWLNVNKDLTDNQKIFFRQWTISACRTLRLMRPKHFLTNVISPQITVSPKYAHSMYLINLTKLFLNECQLMTLTDIDNWDKLLIQLANLLDGTRWNITNFSRYRVELCEKIIVTLQPLLHYAAYIVKRRDIENIKDALASCHLLTVSHFLRMWGNDYITIEGMDEQFIMTVQSQSHISYSNLNESSTQKCQEEFIFSIATYMPKFTVHETKSFIANYLCSAKIQNIHDASFFLIDCVMNAIMRVIVYMKTAAQDGEQCSWDYVENALVNFFDAVNTSKMSCIYDIDVDLIRASNTLSKLIMVVKQLENSRQFPLLVVIRRMIDGIYQRMDIEAISQLLIQIASIKTENSQEALGYNVELLVRTLNLKQKYVEQLQ